jgi:phosphatidylglycerol:prolipoprotein diacylglycerol transferase
MPPRAWYTLFMLLALVVFLVVRHFLPKPPAVAALPWRKRAALAAAGFIGGALGARLPFAVASEEGWLSAGGWIADGKTITTGLAGAYLAVEIAKRMVGVRAKTGDTFALPLALAVAVGRWGCFCNGCCYGRPTDLPWGVTFFVNGEPIRCHPTQIYESFFHFLMAGVLLLALRCDVLRHQRLKLYLICYGAYRFLTEFIRPEPIWHAGLTFYQWAALALIAILTVQWRFDRRLPPPEPAGTPLKEFAKF